MKRFIPLLFLLLVLGCATKAPNVGLDVSFTTRGCSGIKNSTSEARVIPEGLSVVSSILSDNPCYKLTKAEISRKNLNVTVYFTFAKEAGECIDCVGVHSLVYTISGTGLNTTGVNVTIISYFANTETSYSFIS